jgi:opacity protein-like surface antigen
MKSGHQLVEKCQDLSFRGAEGDEESSFFLHFYEMQIPRFARNDSQNHFFNKLLPPKLEVLMSRLLLVALFLLLPATLPAQEAPKAELSAGYSFANLQLLGTDRPNAHGWNASVSVNLNRWFGLVTEFGGLYGASTSRTFAFIPVVETFDAKAHTFLFGPRFTLRKEKFSPFAHVLLGGARLNSTITNFFPSSGFTSRFSSSSFNFALALGGGMDYKFRDRWAWRVQTDYLQSGFFGATQNNFRLSTGPVFYFGQ